MELFDRHKSIFLHPEKCVNRVGLHMRVFSMPTMNNLMINENIT